MIKLGETMSGVGRKLLPSSRGLVPRTGLHSTGALAGIRTPDLLGHYSSCSTGLSYKRVTGEERLQAFAVGRHDADRGGLPFVGRVFLDDEYVGNLPFSKSSSERTQFRFIADMERDGVGAARVLFDERLAGSVDQLGGLGAEGEIGSDDAIVRQILVNGNAYGT